MLYKRYCSKIVILILLCLFVFSGCQVSPEKDLLVISSQGDSTSTISEDSEASIEYESSDIASGTSSQRTNTAYPETFMIEQGENYFDFQPGLECSAFSSAYILRHYGEKAEGLRLFEDFPGKISSGGVMPTGIVDFFNSREYTAEYICDGTVDEIKTEVAKGAPVIVFIHVSEPYSSTHNTHYIPVVGYDEENLYFAESLAYYANCKNEEGLSYNRKTDIEKFNRLWNNIDGMWNYPYFKIIPKQ